MSDFLGRLAARALGQVSPVRPRLPGRFESAVPLANVESPLIEECVEVAPERTLTPRPPLPSALTPPGRGGERQEDSGEERVGEERSQETLRAETGLDVGVERRPGLTPGATQFRPPGSENPSSREPGGRRSVAQGVNPGRGPVPGKSLAPAPREIPFHEQPGRVEPLRHRPDPPLREEEIVWDGTTLSVNPRRLAEPHAGDARDEAPAPRRPLVPRSTVLHEQPDLALSPSPARGGGVEAARERGPGGEGPTIRVTIGRIEVRATAPAPPPAPAARPAGPRLSLEDYLRRRSEGRT